MIDKNCLIKIFFILNAGTNMYFYIIYQSSLKKIIRNQNKHFHGARDLKCVKINNLNSVDRKIAKNYMMNSSLVWKTDETM